MNAPHDLPELAQRLGLTREPLPASRKTYVTGSLPDVRVPQRDISLTNGETVSVYDTSGPYTDPTAEIDLKRGLPCVRDAFIV